MNYKFYFKNSPTNILSEGNTGQYDNFDIDECIRDNFGEHGKASLRQMKDVLPKRIFKEFCKRQNIDYIDDGSFVIRVKGKDD